MFLEKTGHWKGCSRTDKNVIIENVANASILHPVRGHILALPLKSHEGIEAPVQLVGMINSSSGSDVGLSYIFLSAHFS